MYNEVGEIKPATRQEKSDCEKNEENKEAGGIYLFETKKHAEDYLIMHTARLESLGFTAPRPHL
ncbi:Putative mono-oxygenase ydhR [Bhargavaea ginsengi]|uniref:Putative mono-oxygenase ydhR n=1 Tax=Bhargavaea ginsengi TaxID=426757 RepID=A0A1H6YRU3_9BACL|nr:YdhR family protein [Bhargavaea ginsengi]SEJ44038.1 Putative mono-oxygenase ydhR [Bhargavaea ginsengi]